MSKDNGVLIIGLLTAVTAMACGSSNREPTYWQDVAPILVEDCVACHQEGGIAPFSLDDPDQAAQWAEAVADATKERRMPPWAVTDDGSCGEFRSSRALSDEEIRTIGDWAAAGAPLGEPRDDLRKPEIPTLTGGVEITTPDFVPEIVGGPLAQFDEYRCFVVELERDKDLFMTGYDMIPGNPALVHHALLMLVDPELKIGDKPSNAERIRELDDLSPDRPGWSCFGEAGDGVSTDGTPITWTPGQGVIRLPEGVGVRIPQNHMLVVQMHYNMADEAVRGQSDQSVFQLALAESTPREGFFIDLAPLLKTLFVGETFSLEPGRESVVFTWEQPLAPLFRESSLQSIDLYGVMPHMHEFGRKIHMDVDQGGVNTCAVDVQRWDFNWQLIYFYQEPIVLTRQSTLRGSCDYNTVGRTEPVSPGWGTQNEMCLMGLLLVP